LKLIRKIFLKACKEIEAAQLAYEKAEKENSLNELIKETLKGKKQKASEAEQIYKDSIQETNRRQTNHYGKDMVQVMGALQSVEEQRTEKMKEALTDYKNAESTTIPLIYQCLANIEACVDIIDPAKDSLMFENDTKSQIPLPSEKEFEPYQSTITSNSGSTKIKNPINFGSIKKRASMLVGRGKSQNEDVLSLPPEQRKKRLLALISTTEQEIDQLEKIRVKLAAVVTYRAQSDASDQKTKESEQQKLDETNAHLEVLRAGLERYQGYLRDLGVTLPSTASPTTASSATVTIAPSSPVNSSPNNSSPITSSSAPSSSAPSNLSGGATISPSSSTNNFQSSSSNYSISSSQHLLVNFDSPGTPENHSNGSPAMNLANNYLSQDPPETSLNKHTSRTSSTITIHSASSHENIDQLVPHPQSPSNSSAPSPSQSQPEININPNPGNNLAAAAAVANPNSNNPSVGNLIEIGSENMGLREIKENDIVELSFETRVRQPSSSDFDLLLDSMKTPSKTAKNAVALYDFESNAPGELNFKAGEVITILRQNESGWWKGKIGSQEGLFPHNYVEIYY